MGWSYGPSTCVLHDPAIQRRIATFGAGKGVEALSIVIPSQYVIVSHKPNIMDAFGKDWFDLREGEASIFRPDGNGGSKFVGRVQAADWAKLAQ